MQAPISLKLAGQTWWLSAARVLFWEETRTLVAADLHFGKTGHFRKSSIPIPQSVFRQDLQRLFDQIQHFNPARLIVVGDMFHSHHNAEMDWFESWRKSMESLPIVLVRGNHDILALHWYESLDIDVKDGVLTEGPFQFQHEPDLINPPVEGWTISGHIHPGVRLQGLGKQSARFPCFHIQPQQVLMPAFSDFSGLHCVRPKPHDQIFAIIPGSHGVFNANLIQIQ